MSKKHLINSIFLFFYFFINKTNSSFLSGLTSKSLGNITSNITSKLASLKNKIGENFTKSNYQNLKNLLSENDIDNQKLNEFESKFKKFKENDLNLIKLELDADIKEAEEYIKKNSLSNDSEIKENIINFKFDLSDHGVFNRIKNFLNLAEKNLLFKERLKLARENFIKQDLKENKNEYDKLATENTNFLKENIYNPIKSEDIKKRINRIINDIELSPFYNLEELKQIQSTENSKKLEEELKKINLQQDSQEFKKILTEISEYETLLDNAIKKQKLSPEEYINLKKMATSAAVKLANIDSENAKIIESLGGFENTIKMVQENINNLNFNVEEKIKKVKEIIDERNKKQTAQTKLKNKIDALKKQEEEAKNNLKKEEERLKAEELQIKSQLNQNSLDKSTENKNEKLKEINIKKEKLERIKSEIKEKSKNIKNEQTELDEINSKVQQLISLKEQLKTQLAALSTEKTLKKESVEKLSAENEQINLQLKSNKNELIESQLKSNNPVDQIAKLNENILDKVQNAKSIIDEQNKNLTNILEQLNINKGGG